LLISQVEVSVKTFFLKIGDHLPKPEIYMVGATFGESECRHERSYSHLLEVLGLNEEFEKIYDIPAVIDRHNYLKKYKDFASSKLEERFLKSLILFSLFIENVSLFSQFFIIQSFNKHRKYLRDISNVVSLTSKEEAVHASFIFFIINEIRKESPEFFTEELEESICNFCKKAFKAEMKILDWIFEEGDTDFIKRKQVEEFTKNRFNESLESIGFKRIFEIDKTEIEKTLWFEEELYSNMHQDFFDTRPISYTRKSKPITSDSIF
jgi:ribonucleoside-diphosphate reductase beta chain